MLLTLGLSLVIGLLLGLLGGGGSILTVPMLVYMLNVDPKNAILTSFVVVGLSSLIALIPHAKRGSVCWKSGVFFGMTGMAGAYSGGHVAAHFSGDLLMTLFGLVCLMTGSVMILGRRNKEIQSAPDKPFSVCPLKVPYLRVLFDGFFVGGLTGMVGVGGGFLIVPALTLLVGFPMQGAIGTSLLIISMNAVAGLAGYSQHVALDIHLTVLVAVGAIAGSAIGAGLSAYVNPSVLRKAFGLMVILVAAYTLSQSVTVQLMDSVDSWLEDPRNHQWSLLGLLVLWLLIRLGTWIHKSKVVFLNVVDLTPKENC